MAYIHCSKNAVNGLQDGSSWENAFLTLEEALFAANTLTSSQTANVIIDTEQYDIGVFTLTRSVNIIGSMRQGSLSKTIINLDQLNINIETGAIERCNIESAHWVTKDPNLAAININSPTTGLSIYFKYNSLSGYRFVHSETLTKLFINDSNINVSDLGIEGLYNLIELSNSNMACNNIAVDVEVEMLTTTKSNIISTDTGLNFRYSTTPISTNINGSLIKAPNCITMLNPNNNHMELQSNTFDGNINIATKTAGTIMCKSNIFLGDVPNGEDVFGYVVYLQNAYLQEPTSVEYSADNILLTKRPKFVNDAIGDYRILHGIAETLEPFELLQTNEQYKFNKYSQKLNIKGAANIISPFNYKFGNSLTLSDYGKEKEFADVMFYNLNNIGNTVDYNAFANKTFYVKDSVTKSSFSLEASGVNNLWPYEWDHISISTPAINKQEYILPRSIIDVTNVIKEEFNVDMNAVSIGNFKTNAIKHKDYKGLAFDYERSDRTHKMLWSIDEQNNLSLVNIHDGKIENKYPAFSKKVNADSFWIKPSGLIKYGKVDGGYNYMKEDDPTVIIKGVDDQFNFEWLCTEIDTSIEIGGMVAHKDNLYIGAKYTNNNESQILIYPSKGSFDNYVKMTNNKIVLPVSGLLPSDLTVLEDGTFLVSEKNSNKIKHYQPMYDYALISSAGTSDTNLLLREQYDDVNL